MEALVFITKEHTDEHGDTMPVEMVVMTGPNQTEFRRVVLAPCGHVRCTLAMLDNEQTPILSVNLN